MKGILRITNKGNFINWYKSTNYYLENSIIIGVGDDLTDEDMFSPFAENTTFTLSSPNNAIDEPKAAVAKR